MWVITHTLTGMALGAVLGGRGVSVWLIAIAALVLHLLLDIVPHWDYTSTRSRGAWAVADVAASAVALGIAAGMGADRAVLVAAVVSALPDLDVLNALWRTERRIRLFPSHWRTFPHGAAPPLPGTALQALIALVSLGILLTTGL